MPPKKNRLSKKDFSLISKKKIIRGSFFDISIIEKEGLPSFKVSCVVSKKTAKRAVDRNKMKRKIYNLFMEHKNELKPNFYIIYPKREVLYTKYDNLNSELKNIL